MFVDTASWFDLRLCIHNKTMLPACLLDSIIWNGVFIDASCPIKRFISLKLPIYYAVWFIFQKFKEKEWKRWDGTRRDPCDQLKVKPNFIQSVIWNLNLNLFFHRNVLCKTLMTWSFISRSPQGYYHSLTHSYIVLAGLYCRATLIIMVANRLPRSSNKH